MSDLFLKKEQPWANSPRHYLQKSDVSDSLEKKEFFLCFWQFFPFFMPKSELLPFLFARSLFFKEQRERFAFFQERIAHSPKKNERVTQKTDARISNPVYSDSIHPTIMIPETDKQCLQWWCMLTRPSYSNIQYNNPYWFHSPYAQPLRNNNNKYRTYQSKLSSLLFGLNVC